jgi:hypothetical protein
MKIFALFNKIPDEDGKKNGGEEEENDVDPHVYEIMKCMSKKRVI